MWSRSPWQCLVGLPHNQKSASCVGVRQTDWNLPQNAALHLLTCRRWTLSHYFMRWSTQPVVTYIRLLYTTMYFPTWAVAWRKSRGRARQGKTQRRKGRLQGLFQREHFSTGNNLHVALRRSWLQDWRNFFTVTHMEDISVTWSRIRKIFLNCKTVKPLITTISGIFHITLQYSTFQCRHFNFLFVCVITSHYSLR